MTVGIFSGREGVGKTTQLITLAKAYPPVRWIALELKDIQRLQHEENIKLCVGYKTYQRNAKKAMMVDPVATLRTVSECKDAILNDMNTGTIVVDGISDLRDYATSVWCIKYNEETGENISTPKYKDWSSWGEINQLVRDILEPLINYALTENINLWLTAQMKEEYVNDVKVGYTPDIKSWMSYPVQCLFILYRTKEYTYNLECEKEPYAANWREENIEKDKGVLKALLEHNLVEKTDAATQMSAKENEYMIRYGKNEHMYITAISTEEAEKQFLRQYPDAQNYEVLE